MGRGMGTNVDKEEVLSQPRRSSSFRGHQRTPLRSRRSGLDSAHSFEMALRFFPRNFSTASSSGENSVTCKTLCGNSNFERSRPRMQMTCHHLLMGLAPIHWSAGLVICPVSVPPMGEPPVLPPILSLAHSVAIVKCPYPKT